MRGRHDPAPQPAAMPGTQPRGLRNFPPPETVGPLTSRTTRRPIRARSPREFMLVPTTCFNCESACGLLAYVDQGRPARSASSRATRRTPARRGRNCAKGPATINQVTDPERILYPLRRVGRARRAASGSGSAGTRRSTTSPRRIRAAIVEDRRNEVMYHVGRPGEDGFAERFLLSLGRRRPQLPHQHLLSRRARRLRVLDGATTGPRPTTPTPRSSAADQLAPRDRPLLQPARPAHHRGQGRRREAGRAGHRGCPTPPRHADYWLSPRPGSEAAILLAIASHLIADRADRPRVRAALGQLGGVPASACTPTCRADLRGVRRPRSTADYARVHVRVRRGGGAGRRSRTLARGRRDRRRRGHRRSRRTSGARPRPATSAAGRWPARLFFLNVLLGAVGTEGGTVPERAGTSSSPHGHSTSRRGHDRVERAALAAGVPAGAATRCPSCCRTSSRRAAASSTSTSSASTTRCGPTPTGCQLDRGAAPTRRRSAATSR